MQMNKTTDMPTLKASALIMRLDLGASSASPRIMKKNAVERAANMPRNATAISMFMVQIIQ